MSCPNRVYPAPGEALSSLTLDGTDGSDSQQGSFTTGQADDTGAVEFSGSGTYEVTEDTVAENWEVSAVVAGAAPDGTDETPATSPVCE